MPMASAVAARPMNKGLAGAVDNPRENIPPRLIGAEPVRPARRVKGIVGKGTIANGSLWANSCGRQRRDDQKGQEGYGQQGPGRRDAVR